MKIKFNATNIPLFLSLFILIIIIAWVYQDLLFSPNSFLMQKNGDGLKNYFLFAWVAKYGSLSGYTGTNYPFGETILYTDSMPIFSLSLFYLNKLFPFISEYSIGILHLSMLLLFPICLFYLYKVFKHYEVNHWIASLGALLITLNCPSNSRILLHFGLFFIILFPILLYQTVTFNNSFSKKIKLLLFLLFGYYIHGYTGAIWSGIIIAYFLITLLLKEQKKLAFQGFILSTLPTIIYSLSVSIIDNHLWRTKHPLALFDFKITLNHFFGNILQKDIVIHESLQFNYWFWVSCILVILAMLKNRKPLRKFIRIEYNIFLLLGLAYIFYGTSIPLKFQVVLTSIPQLEQLRDLQRFGWVAYLCISFPFIIYQNKYYSALLVIPLLSVGIFEGIQYNKKIVENIDALSNPFQYRSPLQNYTSLKEKYSSILAVPFHFKADVTNAEIDQMTIEQYHLVYTTGIPSINAYLSRLSYVEENLKQLFTLPSPHHKNILKQYFNENDSLLIIKAKENVQLPNNIPLVEIGELDQIKLYKGYTKDFFNSEVNYDSIISKALIYESFEHENNDEGFLSHGVKIGNTHGKVLLYEQNQLQLDTSFHYNLGIWVKHYQMDSLYLNSLQIEQGHQVLAQESLRGYFTYMDEKWGGFRLKFKPINNTSPVKVFLISRREKNVYWHEKLYDIPEKDKMREQPILFDDLTINKIPMNEKSD
ncbi:hypothetical protein [Flammeovirga sp. EKP202]|uniref:hypothetical protein n=1 Tax=Flammeovirga sp. EKP202 TaxID=2770592 RepID=UPI0019A85B2D|nr:hypothetical protein [Flammeovirga sp. EKP202]MBD0404208.1 hypothetical protein [Flammeovirga sp. EKP202]